MTQANNIALFSTYANVDTLPLSFEMLFTEARTHGAWRDKHVDLMLLEEAYELAKMGPTSTNCCPMRIIFIQSKEAKLKLKNFLDEGNVHQTLTAPVTAIIGYDLDFYKKLPTLSPHNNSITWFQDNPTLAQETAFRNGTLQAAYFIIATRSVGLDCGPMSGFDNEAVDAAFFGGTNIKSNILINIGYGDHSQLDARLERLDFNESCRFL